MRSRVYFIIGILFIAGAVAALYMASLSPLPGEKVVAPPAIEPAFAVLTEANGEVFKKNQDGEVRLIKGATLRASDEIQTGADARATLEMARGEVQIQLDAGTTALVLGQDRGVQRLFLSAGALRAVTQGPALDLTVAGMSGAVRVKPSPAGSGAREAGEVRILADGKKQVIVGGVSGVVEVTNAGESVSLGQLQATRIVSDAAPAAAFKIPASILLKVQWPKDNELATNRLKLRGVTNPAALVRVRGVRVMSDGQGRFDVEVPLDEGMNDLRVDTQDAAGHAASSRYKVKVDTTPADVGVETSPEMWKRRKNDDKAPP